MTEPNCYCFRCQALLPEYKGVEDRMCDDCRPIVEAAHAANGLNRLIFGDFKNRGRSIVYDYVGAQASDEFWEDGRD